MKCPKCGQQMINKGNVSNITYASFSPQHDDLYICENCKVKINKRVVDSFMTIKNEYDDYETSNEVTSNTKMGKKE